MREELLALLVCPVTRTALRWDEERRELVSEAAGLAFPVRDGVPVMLVEEARILPPHAKHGEGDRA
ncbi:MAG TPA: Trm112 family protein [Allosphingosinicella sp.]|jgi:hypothetical protein